MAMCELYKDQYLTIRTNGNIYYGTMLSLYKTFNNKIVEVFYNGAWYPAKIIGRACEKEMIKINDNLTCSEDLVLFDGTKDKPVSEYKVNDLIKLNDHDVDKITTCFGEAHIGTIEKLNVKSDWLFGVEILDHNATHFTLTDGYIVSIK